MHTCHIIYEKKTATVVLEIHTIFHSSIKAQLSHIEHFCKQCLKNVFVKDMHVLRFFNQFSCGTFTQCILIDNKTALKTFFLLDLTKHDDKCLTMHINVYIKRDLKRKKNQ